MFKGALFAPIIRSFASDDYVVHVAFEQAGRRDADELAAFLKLGEIGRATVTHAAAQTADELVYQAGERAFVGNLAFDAFWNRLAAFRAFLRVAIRRTRFHGAQRAHAAIGFESAALIQNRFARRFFGAGEEAADHHRISSGGDGLGDVAGKFDAAIGDHGDAGAFRSARRFDDRGDLRYACTGNHASGAD